jgi:hypothetical protein
MKPSTAKVYALLKVRGVDGVSPDEARRWAGCDRLAARVAELRAEGHDIETVYQTVRGKRFARYIIREPRPQPYQMGLTESEARLMDGNR